MLNIFFLLRGLATPLFPDSIIRNRGFIPGLLVAVIIWGSVITWILSGVTAKGTQLAVNITTYLSLGVAVLAFFLGAWKDSSQAKTVCAAGWSIIGILSYAFLSALIPGTIMLLTWPLGLEEVVREFIAYGAGGMLVFYTWYRVNLRFFRIIKSYISSRKKEEDRSTG